MKKNNWAYRYDMLRYLDDGTVDFVGPMEKKIDAAFECVECGNTDGDTLMILRDAPHVVECCKCGHPNDARWDHDECDLF